jgi:hypothetical protein
VSCADFEARPSDAVMVTEAPELGVVVMAKVALVCPRGMVTLAGTLAAGSLLVSEILVPLPPAGALRVTVPCDDVPPVTVVGLTLTAESVLVPPDACFAREGPRPPGPATWSDAEHAVSAGTRTAARTAAMPPRRKARVTLNGWFEKRSMVGILG